MDSVPKFKLVLELKDLKNEVNLLLTNKKIETFLKKNKKEIELSVENYERDKKEFDIKYKELIEERKKKNMI